MRKRFVCLWFRYLKTDWHSRRQPAFKSQAMVLTVPDHGRLVISEANALAVSKGILPGMLLADARALFPDLQVKEDADGLSEKLLTAIASFCIRFTPVAAVDLPEGIILDSTGCTHLWGGDQGYLNEISRRFLDRGYETALAIADSIGAAWAICRYGKHKTVIEPGAHIRIIRSLPAEALRINLAITERLYKLGLQSIGQLLDMPASSLRRRYGDILLQRLQQATGEVEEYIVPVQPVPEYLERLPCIEPITTATGIEIALRQLLKQMCLRLQKEQKGLRQVILSCYRIEGKMEQIMVHTNRPTHHAAHLFKLLQLKIANIQPGWGIELFTLEARSVEDHTARQDALWQLSGGMRDIRIAELFDRIAVRVGAERILRYLPEAHYWPERSIKKAASLQEVPEHVWPQTAPRPIQLLPIPEAITVTAPVPDYPPMYFRYKNKLHKVLHADGPERIEQEWWLQQGEHRDYYIVEDTEGKRYWIFRLGHYDADKNNQWFLHGFFA